MYLRLISLIGFLFLLAISVACGPSSSQSTTQSSSEPAEEEINVNESEAAATEKPAEDKSKRPSPPRTAEIQVGDLAIKLDYSSPSVKGRAIWGELVPYNKVWRTGANEANVLSLSQDALINDQPVSAGQYALFSIPGDETWTIILNEDYHQWGAYEYDENKDVIRFQVKTETEKEIAEMMEFTLSEEGEGKASLHFKWEHIKFQFPISIQ